MDSVSMRPLDELRNQKDYSRQVLMVYLSGDRLIAMVPTCLAAVQAHHDWTKGMMPAGWCEIPAVFDAQFVAEAQRPAETLTEILGEAINRA